MDSSKPPDEVQTVVPEQPPPPQPATQAEIKVQQQAEVDALKAQVADLEARVTALEQHAGPKKAKASDA